MDEDDIDNATIQRYIEYIEKHWNVFDYYMMIPESIKENHLFNKEVNRFKILYGTMNVNLIDSDLFLKELEDMKDSKNKDNLVITYETMMKLYDKTGINLSNSPKKNVVFLSYYDR